MKTKSPPLTIITVHLDNFIGLDETRDSLSRAAPGSSAFEWIVIDGNSKIRSSQDSEILTNTRQQADTFISEVDQGTYDAMNKGAEIATGDYLLFLNSGDLIHPAIDWDSLNQAMAKKPDMIWGQCAEEYMNGEFVSVKTRSPRWAWYGMPVHHSATIYKRAILNRPAFNLSYRIGADYDLLLGILDKKPKILVLKSLISIFRHGGVSRNEWRLALTEEESLRTKYFGFGQIGNALITKLKCLNRQLAKSSSLRRFWRNWI